MLVQRWCGFFPSLKSKVQIVTINIVWMEELEFQFNLIDLPIQNSVDKFPNPYW